MSYYEYLDIDRKTVTKEKSDSTVAKRYVYDGAASEHPQRHYAGKWRPMENSEVVNGVILHRSEIDADESLKIRGMCLRRATDNVDVLRQIIKAATLRMEKATKEVERCQRWLHWYETQLMRMANAKSLREMLRIRVERRPVDGQRRSRVQ